ncbi:hypothetical protein PS2_021791 [Malus domestica]
MCNLLKKVIDRTKKDWHERISEAFWAYRMTHRTPTQAMPYALVYGMEDVLPLESQVPSLRIAIQEGLTEEENAKLRLQELEALEKNEARSSRTLGMLPSTTIQDIQQEGLPKVFPNWKSYLGITKAYHHNSHNKKQIHIKMG